MERVLLLLTFDPICSFVQKKEVMWIRLSDFTTVNEGEKRIFFMDTDGSGKTL